MQQTLSIDTFRERLGGGVLGSRDTKSIEPLKGLKVAHNQEPRRALVVFLAVHQRGVLQAEHAEAVLFDYSLVTSILVATTSKISCRNKMQERSKLLGLLCQEAVVPVCEW